MSSLEVLKKAFDEIELPYVVREDENYQYLFIGDPEDASCLLAPRDNYKTTKLDNLLKRHGCFEFENNMLTAWNIF